MLIYNSCFDLFKSENYTPSIIRPFPLVKSENKCEYPFTNNKKNNIVNDDIYINNYGNRKILNPDEYLKLVEKLLTDLSKKEIDIINIPDNMLNEIDYNGDKDYIINFMNNEIKKLVNEKKYLQNNGTWKYEYFNVSNPSIYYYEVINNNIIMNIPEKFNLFKIIYTLGNPLRSSYTSCLAFITLINNKLTLQFTKLVNDNNDKNIKNNLDIIPTDALEFEFLDTIANEKFNKYKVNNGDIMKPVLLAACVLILANVAQAGVMLEELNQIVEQVPSIDSTTPNKPTEKNLETNGFVQFLFMVLLILL